MKKLLAGFLSACLTLSIAGCGTAPTGNSAPTTVPEPDVTGSSPTEISQEQVVDRSMHALALPTVREEIFSDDGTLLFSLSYQKTDVIVNDETAQETILGDLQTRIGGILTEADQIYAAAQLDYPEAEYWSHYFIDFSYTPTRLDQEILSLFGNQTSYSGGAHPSLITDSVTYDLKTGQVLELKDILCSGYNQDTLCNLLLKSLEGKAAELSYDYQQIVTERFTGDAANIQDWYFSRSGLCFHFPPYDIAPYSSGTIIAELPYTELTGLLREEYFPTQTEASTGSMYAHVDSAETSARFDFVTDVVLAESSTPIILYSDASVTNLRIEIGTQLEDSNTFISSGVVFMADQVSIGDAIRIYADFTDISNLLRLVYYSGDHEVSALISLDSTTNNVILTSE